MSFPENSLSHTPILDIFKNSQKLWFWMSFPRNQPESRPEILKSTISPVLDEFSRKTL